MTKSKQKFSTSVDLGSKTFSEKFSDPADYIYEAYKELSETDAKNFLEYRKNWKASLNLQEFDFPLYLMTEQTFSCNFTCPQCILGNKEEQKKYETPERLLPLSLFHKIIDEGSKYGCRSLSVHYINEPLLVSDLPERIAYARKKGFLDIHLVTNAQLLTEKKSRELIESGVTRVMVSIDANTKETFEKLRPGGTFEKVKQNLINFMKIRNSLGLKLPVVRVSFVAQEDNIHELEDFKKFWSGIVDYIHIQSFQKPYEDAKDSRLSENNSIPDQIFKCDQPFNRIVIRADGTVLPCCSFNAFELPVGNVSDSQMYNINNETIYDVWNSKKMKDLRKVHYEGRYKEIDACKKCVEWF